MFLFRHDYICVCILYTGQIYVSSVRGVHVNGIRHGFICIGYRYSSKCQVGGRVCCVICLSKSRHRLFVGICDLWNSMHWVTRCMIHFVVACSHGFMHGSHKNFIPISTTFAAQHGLNKPTAPSLVYLHIRLIAKYKMRCIKIESSCFWACSSHVRMQRVISTRKH